MNTKEDSFDYQILRLTSAFYNDYPNPPFIEILKKKQRSYNCLLIQSHYGYFICVPYRSQISHKYAYRFKNSKRSKHCNSGLDYTKAVIITDNRYIDSMSSVIDQDEYKETRTNIHRIKQEVLAFVDDYVNHITKNKMLSTQEFRRRYQFSPLKYFHKELGVKLPR